MRMIALCTLLAACGAALTPAEQADASYKAQQAACIDKSKTRAESEACRDEVKRNWSTDAGTGVSK